MSTNKFTTNNKTTLVAVSNADGETPVYVYADPATHALVTSGGGGGSSNVGGNAASGSPPSGNPVLVAGQDGTNVRTLLTDTTGKLQSVNKPTSLPSTIGTITANGQSVVCTLAGSETSVSVVLYGTYASGASVIQEYSADGGTVYAASPTQNFANINAATSFAGYNTAGGGLVSNSTSSFISLVPPGATHFRLRAAGFGASGTINVVLTPCLYTGPIPMTYTNATLTTPNLNTTSDTVSGTGVAVTVGSEMYQYNGATWDRVRISNVNKTATATASGDTALWTPTSSKKFRVQAYSIQITADAATAGGADIDVILRDSTTALPIAFSVFVPAVAGTAFGNTSGTGWCTIGNGILSALANNVLNINLSAALTSGKVRVIVTGTEE